MASRIAFVDGQCRTRHGTVAFRYRQSSGSDEATGVVLLHGLFGDCDVWSSVAHGLALDKASVMSIDLPLHGRSKAACTSVDTQYEAIADVLDGLGSVVLVGHSFGGLLATQLAAHQPERVRGLVLLAPLGLGSQIDQEFLDAMTQLESRDDQERALARLGSDLPKPGHAYLDKARETLSANRQDLKALIANLAVDGHQRVDCREALASVDMPVSIVWGREDRILNWEHAFNAPPTTALHLLDGAGHMPMQESTRLVRQVIGSVRRQLD